MKILIILLLLIPGISFGQDTTKTGIIRHLEKDAGTAGEKKFIVHIYIDIDKNDTIKFIWIKYKKVSVGSTGIFLINSKELPQFIKSTMYISSLIKNDNPEETSNSFCSEKGACINAIFYKKGGGMFMPKGWKIDIHNVYENSRAFKSGTMVEVKVSEMDEFINKIQQIQKEY